MTLTEYINEVREILKDPYGNFYTNQQIGGWVNRARKEVAKDSQCVRYMPAPLAYFTAITVTAPGSGYTTATATISGPDGIGGLLVQAAATVNINAGVVQSITITNPGYGYVAAPTITIEGDGTGATATATLSDHVTTVVGLQRYSHAPADAVLAATVPGIGPILGIQSLAISWGSMKPTLDRTDFSAMQAYAYSWGVQIMSWPQVWAEYRRGAGGEFAIWPAATQVSQMELDCYCSVADLTDSQTVDLITEPFDAAVKYYAAYRGYLYSQRTADAKGMMSLYRMQLQQARETTSPASIPTMYPGL